MKKENGGLVFFQFTVHITHPVNIKGNEIQNTLNNLKGSNIDPGDTSVGSSSDNKSQVKTQPEGCCELLGILYFIPFSGVFLICINCCILTELETNMGFVVQ